MPGDTVTTFHTGVDIAAAVGTPVFAVQGGDVTFAYDDLRGGGGKVVMIETPYARGTFVSRYGHLKDILVRKGETVERGDIIGTVGSTGFSTGPHLHFEVYTMIAEGQLAWHDPARWVCDYSRNLQVPHYPQPMIGHSKQKTITMEPYNRR